MIARLNVNGRASGAIHVQEVEDHLEAAAKKVKKLIPSAADSESKKLFQEALDELKEGQEAIAESKSTSASQTNQSIIGGWWRHTRLRD